MHVAFLDLMQLLHGVPLLHLILRLRQRMHELSQLCQRGCSSVVTLVRSGK
jgi:hypothetical protein